MGAQIVSVPESVAIAIADRALTRLVIDFGILALCMLVVIDLLLIFFVILPVSRLARTATAVSQGDMEVEALPVRGKDEIAMMGEAFNRMLDSLRRAMKLLSSEES